MNIQKEIVIHLQSYSGGDYVAFMAEYFNVTETVLIAALDELELNDVLYVDECDTGLFACLYEIA